MSHSTTVTLSVNLPDCRTLQVSAEVEIHCRRIYIRGLKAVGQKVNGTVPHLSEEDLSHAYDAVVEHVLGYRRDFVDTGRAATF